MIILWVCDVPGWAFDNESRCAAKGFPDDEHRYAYVRTDSTERIAAAAAAADVVVIHDVRGLRHLPREIRGKVVQRITGSRSLTGWRR